MKQIFYLFVITIISVFHFSCETNVDELSITNKIEQGDLSKSTNTSYDVRVLLDYSRLLSKSSPGDIQGFYAIDQNSGEVYYTRRIGQYEYENVFYDLPEGTYEFGAFEGYWEGASSKIVTLSSEGVGEDGFFNVTLSAWSE